MAIKVGNKVAFAASVVRRAGHDKMTADMRGIVLEIRGNVARVDTHGTWVNDEGNSVRSIPLANLCQARPDCIAFTE